MWARRVARRVTLNRCRPGALPITPNPCRQATDSTVLGNFSDKQFTNSGVTSTFFKKDGKFYVRTDDSRRQAAGL